MAIKWTIEDATQATKQGWDVFYAESKGVLEIERVDEMQVFPDDDSAIMFVIDKATKGDKLAQKALLITKLK